MNSLPQQLGEARHQLLQLQEYTLLKDLIWHPAVKSWVLRFSITIGQSARAEVPLTTQWYAVISPTYPLGTVEIYPDSHNGITATFQHQSLNKPQKTLPWYSGNICVNTSRNSWGRKELSTQDHSAEGKLLWHVQRAIDWVKAAATNQLVILGEPFELPYPIKGSDWQVIFNEDANSFTAWHHASPLSGVFQYHKVAALAKTYAVTQFYNRSFKMSYLWGQHITDSKESEQEGIYIVLPAIPVIDPWETPANWTQLFELATQHGVDLKKILYQIIKNHPKRHFQMVAIGFPIPSTIGSTPGIMHWYFAELPTIVVPKSLITTDIINKFKADNWFAAQKPIQWAHSENWNKDQVCSRGKICSPLRNGKILLIGCGAIGSLLAELFIRLGIIKMVMLDEQISRVGNLSRHTLSMKDVRQYKAEALAHRLNGIFPFVEVKAINLSFQKAIARDPQLLNDINIIIDATADDDVLVACSGLLVGQDKTLISLSAGLKAERLYCYVANSGINQDISTAFFNKINPKIAEDKQRNLGLTIQREGIGCWAPIFPARLDDLQLLLNAAVTSIEHAINQRDPDTLIMVAKQTDQYQRVIGVNVSYE